MSYADGDPIGYRLRIAPGADLTADPSTYTWTDITDAIDFSFPIGETVGAEDEQSETNSEVSFTLINHEDGRGNVDGRFTIDNPESDLYPYWDLGLPVEWSVDLGDGLGWRDTAVQYVGSIVDDWPAMTPHRCLTHVTAAGTFRRLGQGRALDSPIRRTIHATDPAPVAYWPLEDGSAATRAASGILGGAPMRVEGAIGFGSGAAPAGSLPIVEMANNSGRMVGTVPATGFVDQWRIEWVARFPTGWSGSGRQPLSWRTEGSYALWDFYADSDSNVILSFPSGTGDGGWATFGTLNDGRPHHFRVEASQDGANITIVGWLDGTLWSFNSAVGRTLGRITEVIVNPLVQDIDDMPSIGHIAVWQMLGGVDDVTPAAMRGHAEEEAHARIERICTEEGQPFAAPTASYSEWMGPQPIASLLEILRDCEATDHGILTDHRGQVEYRALSETYDQTPGLIIDGAGRELFAPFRPVRDDQKRRNRVKATRVGGSEYTVVNQDSVDRHGLYDGDVTVNAYSDDSLPHHAGYVVAVGTLEGKRYPQVTVDCLRAPQLAAAVLDLALGDVIRIDSPPRQSAQTSISLQVRGWTRTYGPGRRKLVTTFNTVRADPLGTYIVQGADNTGRLDSSTVAVVAPATSTATTILTESGDTVPPVTTASHPAAFPVSLNVGGEQVTASASATGLADTFNRANAPNLGSTSTGGYLWASAGGGGVIGADWAIVSNTGRISVPGAGVYRMSFLDALPMTNADVAVSWSYGSTVTGAPIEAGIMLRGTGLSDYYHVRGEINSGMTVTLKIFAPGDVLVGQAQTGITYVAGSLLRLRVRQSGQRLDARLWRAADAEPTNWNLSLVNDDYVGPGWVGIRAGVTVGNTNANPRVVTFDDFAVPSVQGWTVARSVNGVVKAQPVGSPVGLWMPPRLAM